MIESVKQLWIRALKSGDYEQGKGQLLYDGKYCCLGVLCDLYRKETGKGEWDAVEAQRFTDETGDSSVTRLPDGVKTWAGLVDPDPALGFRTAASANDDGVSFALIAELIEVSL